MTINNIHPDLEKYIVDIDTIISDPNNARYHSKENIEDIKLSLQKFGQDQLVVYNPILKRTIKGAGRLEAMRQLNWSRCAVLMVDESEEASIARAISDNKSGESEWKPDVLLRQLQSLQDSDYAESTGFSDEEIKALEKELNGAERSAQIGVNEKDTGDEGKWVIMKFNVTEAQRQVIQAALDKVDLEGDNIDGRSLEMIAAEFLAS